MAVGSPRQSLLAFNRLSDLSQEVALRSVGPVAVPFLVELARDPDVRHRAYLVWLLGAMADPDAADGVPVTQTRQALRSHLPVLLSLLPDDDPQAREAAVYAAAQCVGDDGAGRFIAQLQGRWAVETDPMARSTLVYAAGRVDPVGCADWLTSAIDDSTTAVRMAAVLSIARAGLPWPPAGTTVVVSTSGRDGLLAGCSWAVGDSYLSDVLASYDSPDDVPADLLAALFDSPSRDVRLGRSEPPVTSPEPAAGPLTACGRGSGRRTATTTRTFDDSSPPSRGDKDRTPRIAPDYPPDGLGTAPTGKKNNPAS